MKKLISGFHNLKIQYFPYLGFEKPSLALHMPLKSHISQLFLTPQPKDECDIIKSISFTELQIMLTFPMGFSDPIEFQKS